MSHAKVSARVTTSGSAGVAARLLVGTAAAVALLWWGVRRITRSAP